MLKTTLSKSSFLYEGNTIAFSCFTFYCLVWFFNWNKVHLHSKLYVSCRILSVVILNFNLRIILFFFDNFRAFTLLHRLQITISNKLYRCMTLKYFFYHQIFFQDSAQTEKLTVFSNPKYTACTFWNTEHEHFEILSMKLNCKYWECMDWNPRNTDVPASVFRRYCDTFLQLPCSLFYNDLRILKSIIPYLPSSLYFWLLYANLRVLLCTNFI